jgi:Coenzyme PQQ synthesis protein D (PqqD)
MAGEVYNRVVLPDFPQRRPDLLVERAGREALVYRTGAAGQSAETGGAVHALNHTAALIWDLCDGGRSLAEIERVVRLTFAVPAERNLAADVRATIAEFQSKGLLVD